MTYSLTVNFADAETPLAVGTQLILAQLPTPAQSLQLFRNGVLQASGADYTVAGHIALPSPPPASEDVWIAFYRF